MVRLKTAYWEFDFEAVCPTLGHNLLSLAHIVMIDSHTHTHTHTHTHLHTHTHTHTDKPSQ